MLPVISVYFHGYLNPKFHAGLSDKSKAALAQAGKNAAQWAIEASIAASADAPDQLRAKGSKVHIATEKENKVLEAAMRPAFDAKFSNNEDAKKLIELIGKM